MMGYIGKLKQVRIQLGLIGLGVVLCVPASLAFNPQQQTINQRYEFEAAERALKRGHRRTYRRLEIRLRNYPLHPYLKLKEFSRNLSHQSESSIRNFLHTNAGTPTAVRLQHRWLNNLARRGQWQTLVDYYYPNDDQRLQCYYAKALIQLKQPDRAYAVLEGLWLTGKSLPRQCNKPVKHWYQSGKLNKTLVWQRIHLAMRHGHSRLARYLARYLPENEHFWVALWSKIRRNPEFLLSVNKHFPAGARPDMLRWIMVDGLSRLASKDPQKGAKIWKELQDEYKFQPQEKQRIVRKLAIALMKQNNTEARDWLSQLNLVNMDDKLSGWYAMTAIRDEDWQSALDWINRLDPATQQQHRWLYWRARALEAVGELDEARSYYLVNTDNRSYYGFLAADHIGRAYRFVHRPINYNNDALNKLERIPPILRARELHALKRMPDARREWAYAINRMSHPQLLIAARLAAEWDWPDRAIQTLAIAKYWDDLELRFPLKHQRLVMEQSRKNKINPAWAFAVIRQESAFTPDARSTAGALGLMQILPRTARQVARKLRIRMRGRNSLLNINTNVRLGVRYLKRVSDRYKGHPVLATAAYNAGIYRVKQWLPEPGTSLPADLWIEMVPFKETRNYLKRVLTYTIIYERRLGLPNTTLLERMKPVKNELTIAQKPLQSPPS